MFKRHAFLHWWETVQCVFEHSDWRLCCKVYWRRHGYYGVHGGWEQHSRSYVSLSSRELFYSLRRFVPCSLLRSLSQRWISTGKHLRYVSFSACWIGSLHTNSTKRQRTRWMTKKWNTRKNLPSPTNNMMYFHESSRVEIFKRLYQDYKMRCFFFSTCSYLMT